MDQTQQLDPRAAKAVSAATCRRFAAAGVLLLLCLGLVALFSRSGELFFPAYRSFSKALMALLSSIASIAPFSLWDFLAVALFALFVFGLAWTLVKRRSILGWLSHLSLAFALLLSLFVGGWALNHYAPPLAFDLDLEVAQYSSEDLAQAASFYLDQAARYAPYVPRGEDAQLTRQDFGDLAAVAGASYSGLSGRYPVFAGCDLPVKALLLAGEPLLYSGHVGIFMPLTGESNVPLNCAVADMPFTMCHEAAHRLGLASEEEANFAAFLACSESRDMRFVYAGYYNAFGYCFNKLSALDPQRAQDLLGAYAQEGADPEILLGVQLVFLDRSSTYEHYQAYEGPAEEAGTAVNDAYLKTFGEHEGVRSYGLVVDYLIAWYKAL